MPQLEENILHSFFFSNSILFRFRYCSDGTPPCSCGVSHREGYLNNDQRQRESIKVDLFFLLHPPPLWCCCCFFIFRAAPWQPEAQRPSFFTKGIRWQEEVGA